MSRKEELKSLNWPLIYLIYWRESRKLDRVEENVILRLVMIGRIIKISNCYWIKNWNFCDDRENYQNLRFKIVIQNKFLLDLKLIHEDPRSSLIIFFNWIIYWLREHLQYYSDVSSKQLRPPIIFDSSNTSSNPQVNLENVSRGQWSLPLFPQLANDPFIISLNFLIITREWQRFRNPRF